MGEPKLVTHGLPLDQKKYHLVALSKTSPVTFSTQGHLLQGLNLTIDGDYNDLVSEDVEEDVTGETTHDEGEEDDDMEYVDVIGEDEGLEAVVDGLENAADLPETSHLPSSRTTQSV